MTSGIEISNKEKVINRLKSGEMMIKDYHYTVQHDPDCVKAALLGNLDNYNDLVEEYKRKKWVANLYYDQLIQNKEKEEKDAESYVDYYPWYLDIEYALANDTVNSPVEIIKSVVDQMTDEELNKLREQFGNLAQAFINPNMDDLIAALQDNYIISGHRPKIDTSRIRYE